MDKFKSVFLLSLLILLTIFGCKENEDAVQPVPAQPEVKSAFTKDRNFVEINEVVTFTNSTTNAVRYEWDFGNGQSSTIAAPTVSYTVPGTYTIKLTSYNSEGKSNTASTTVVVGERYLSGFKLNSIDFLTPYDKLPWDANDGPDVRVGIKDSKSSISGWEASSSEKANVTANDLPVTLVVNSTYKLANKQYYVAAEDIDPGTTNGSQFMDGIFLNPYTEGVSTKSYDTGKGSIKFPTTSHGFEFELLFELR